MSVEEIPAQVAATRRAVARALTRRTVALIAREYGIYVALAILLVYFSIAFRR